MDSTALLIFFNLIMIHVCFRMWGVIYRLGMVVFGSRLLPRRLNISVADFPIHKDCGYIYVFVIKKHRLLEKMRLFSTSGYDTLIYIGNLLYCSTNDLINSMQVPCTPGVRKLPLIHSHRINRSKNIRLLSMGK